MDRRNVLSPIVVLLLVAVALALAGCGPALDCSITDYIVNKTADTNDGLCSAADCSLREAVRNANACPGWQTITIPEGSYTLTIAGAEEDAAATGDLDITDDVTIVGEGVPLINGGGLDRVFEVFSPAVVRMETMIVQGGEAQLGAGIRNHSQLTLDGLSIQGNTAVVPPGGAGGSAGGGIFNEAGTLTLDGTQVFTNSADEGGGIHNFATATLIATDLFLGGNTATGSGGGLWNNMAAEATLNDVEIRLNTAGENGGGIYNDGHLEVNLGKFEENTEAAQGGGLFNQTDGEGFLYDAWFTNNSAGLGGAVYNRGLLHLYRSSLTINTAFGGHGAGAYNDVSPAALLLRNVTVSGNMLGAPAAPGGAGIYNHGGEMRVEFVTLAYNSPDGILSDAGSVDMRSTILASHALGNCQGVGSGDYNLADDASCGPLAPHDLSDVNPLLAPLDFNGGTNLSHALNPGSPAIDSGTPDLCTSEDQRGVSRPQGAGCDRGAYEAEGGVMPTVVPSLGTVTGHICYPSETIPPMTAYFQETSTDAVTTLDIGQDQGTYAIDLVPGTYLAYAWLPGFSMGGSYSQAVPCGLLVSCTDHSLLPFAVTAGATTDDIDICDWYGGPGSVPLPPGAVVTTEEPESASATLTMNAFCRFGPGTHYLAAATFLTGEQYPVEGRSPAGLPAWWWVVLPDGRGHCWVSGVTVRLEGPVEGLQVVNAPPIPAAPTQLSILRQSCATGQMYRVMLQWVDVATDETGYRVYRDGTEIASLPAGSTSYTDTPPLGGPYTYAVEAFNAYAVSDQATVQSEVCR